MITEELKTNAIIGLIAFILLGGGACAGRILYLDHEINIRDERINVFKAENDRLGAEIRNAVESNLRLANSLNTLKGAMVHYEAETSAAIARGDAALEKAKAESGKWKARYRSLLDATPANPNDLCGSLDLKLSAYIAQRAEELK